MDVSLISLELIIIKRRHFLTSPELGISKREGIIEVDHGVGGGGDLLEVVLSCGIGKGGGLEPDQVPIQLEK